MLFVPVIQNRRLDRQTDRENNLEKSKISCSSRGSNPGFVQTDGHKINVKISAVFTL
jgi:hypothetical protein